LQLLELLGAGVGTKRVHGTRQGKPGFELILRPADHTACEEHAASRGFLEHQLRHQDHLESAIRDWSKNGSPDGELSKANFAFAVIEVNQSGPAKSGSGPNGNCLKP